MRTEKCQEQIKAINRSEFMYGLTEIRLSAQETRPPLTEVIAEVDGILANLEAIERRNLRVNFFHSNVDGFIFTYAPKLRAGFVTAKGAIV